MIWTPLFRSTDLTESSVVDFVIFFTCSQNLTGIAQACRKHTEYPNPKFQSGDSRSVLLSVSK